MLFLIITYFKERVDFAVEKSPSEDSIYSLAQTPKEIKFLNLNAETLKGIKFLNLTLLEQGAIMTFDMEISVILIRRSKMVKNVIIITYEWDNGPKI